ncbi:MAG TPA: PEGA domain-containing protein [Polyangia bacterium]|jgi:hypothetical protein
MLSKRVVAIAAERPMQKKLAAGLMAAGAVVESVAAVTDLAAGKIDADLVVYTTPGPDDVQLKLLLDRLKENTKLVVVIPAADLPHMVRIVKDPRVNNVLVGDDLQAATLSGIATRVLHGDVFGVEKMMPWGVRIYSMLVGDYQEKSVAIAAISDFAGAMGVRRKYRESIEQAMDELLMNALYDAPVDQGGKPMFTEVPTKTRLSLRLEQKALVQYACDGDTFAVSVRDPYGTLTKETVVKFLEKCLTQKDQIDRKIGGAGLGFYIIANAASQFAINSYPGVATECVVTFDLNAAKVQCKNLGFYEERIDVAGRLATAGPRQRVAAGGGGRAAAGGTPGLVKAALAIAVALVLAAAGLLVYPRLVGPRQGTLVIDSKPKGATITIDGRSRGVAPLRLTDLEAGRAYRVRALLPGYQPQEDLVTVGANEETVVPFQLRLETGSVTVVSQPPGARVFLGADDTGKVTPATLTGLPTGEAKLITLKLDGYQDTTSNVVAPQRGESITHSVTLAVAPGFGSLLFESNPPGAEVSVDGKPVAVPPAGLVLRAGTHEIGAKLAGHVPFQKTITVTPGQRALVAAKLVPGGEVAVKSNLGATLFVDGRAVGPTPQTLVLSEGRHTLGLRSQRPYLSHEVTVEVRVGQKIEKNLAFGTVDVTAPGVVALPPGAPTAGVASFALPVGKRSVTLRQNGQEKLVELDVVAGKSIKVAQF